MPPKARGRRGAAAAPAKEEKEAERSTRGTRGAAAPAEPAGRARRGYVPHQLHRRRSYGIQIHGVSGLPKTAPLALLWSSERRQPGSVCTVASAPACCELSADFAALCCAAVVQRRKKRPLQLVAAVGEVMLPRRSLLRRRLLWRSLLRWSPLAAAGSVDAMLQM